MDTLDPCSDNDINNDVSSLCVEIIDNNRSYCKCTICDRKLSGRCKGNKDSKPTLSKLGCCADRFVDQFPLNMI